MHSDPGPSVRRVVTFLMDDEETSWSSTASKTSPGSSWDSLARGPVSSITRSSCSPGILPRMRPSCSMEGGRGEAVPAFWGDAIGA
eukprot:CAMPEP_0114159050 /NCGR_PEP_ID=MMETSP0043_2-20121206/27563_1 /TAXON_ID=464988 /ORGANISM="Hemiselmis andersenii, Strain CCMP644" /LENGTH=85 /DNA_ID=CAMNT_0001254889 /DNA_START=42 /DNA_END=295 /DNA_ORIENTATION=-